jgi:hypothetical protein
MLERLPVARDIRQFITTKDVPKESAYRVEGR